MGTADIPTEVKRQGREAGHTSSFTAEVKNDGAIHPSSWRNVKLIKDRGNSAFTAPYLCQEYHVL
jgi:hypothetical protein